MSRYRDNVYTNDRRPRSVVIFGLQWQVLESQRVEAEADLSGAMAAAIERLAPALAGRLRQSQDLALRSFGVPWSVGL